MPSDLADMGAAHVGGGEGGEERDAGAGGHFYGGTAVVLFALDQAKDTGDIMPASRAASMPAMVEAPVVQTSSTITTCAPG